MAKLVKKKQKEELECLPNVLRIAELVNARRGKNIKAFDVRGLTLLADSFIICSASSEPQIKAIYNSVKDGMKDIGVPPLHAEGQFTNNWLVLDYGTILVHIFRDKAFEYYDLEGLWGDAPSIELDLDPE